MYLRVCRLLSGCRGGSCLASVVSLLSLRRSPQLEARPAERRGPVKGNLLEIQGECLSWSSGAEKGVSGFACLQKCFAPAVSFVRPPQAKGAGLFAGQRSREPPPLHPPPFFSSPAKVLEIFEKVLRKRDPPLHFGKGSSHLPGRCNSIAHG